MKRFFLYTLLTFLPGEVFAAGVVNDLQGAALLVRDILTTIFPILLAIAVFSIVWGILQFIRNANDEEARKTGRSFILWGIVGVFLMLSVWGLVRILYNTIRFENTAPYTPPGGTYNITPVPQ